MSNRARIRIAALVTTCFVGGLAAFGLASREGSPPSDVAVVEAAKRPDPKVVHRRRVKTVHSRGATASGPGAASPGVVAPGSAPAVVQGAGAPATSAPAPASAASEDSAYEGDEDDELTEPEPEDETENDFDDD